MTSDASDTALHVYFTQLFASRLCSGFPYQHWGYVKVQRCWDYQWASESAQARFSLSFLQACLHAEQRILLVEIQHMLVTSCHLTLKIRVTWMLQEQPCHIAAWALISVALGSRMGTSLWKAHCMTHFRHDSTHHLRLLMSEVWDGLAQ